MKHTIQRPFTYEEGWGVAVAPIWADEFDTVRVGGIADIEVSVTRIGPDMVSVLSDGMPCVRTELGWIPVSEFRPVNDLWCDDAHDLRCRWFATRDEAESHAAYVLETWLNPEPWRNFYYLAGEG